MKQHLLVEEAMPQGQASLLELSSTTSQWDTGAVGRPGPRKHQMEVSVHT